MKEQITNAQRVALLLKLYLDKRDLMEWYGKGKTWVSNKLSEMQTKLVLEGKNVFKGKISTEAFMKFENVELKHFVELAKIEKELKL